MKKILLLFTSFLFTSNLTLFGADSFAAQADQRVSLLNDLSQRVDELLQQASTLEGQIAKQRKSLKKQPSRDTFYKQLRKLWPEVEEHVFVSRVAELFVDNDISINTPTPPHSVKQAILGTLLSPEAPLDSNPATKQELNELLKQATILSDIQEKTAEAEKLKQEAARLQQERKNLRKEAKQEAARLQQEAADREAQEAADREAEKEKRKWANVFAPTPGAKSEEALREERKKLAMQKIQQERAQKQAEEDRLEKAAYLESLRRQYRELRPSAREELKGTMVDPKDQMFFKRLDAQLALEARERSLMKDHNKLEQLKREIIEQERLALLEHYRANLGSFIFHCSEYIKNNPELTDQAKQSLENLIALLEGKRAASGQLTKADFLAMEQNSLLAEVTSVMEEFPEFKLAIKSHFDTANDMWNSILDGYKNPNSVGFNEVSN